jgi:tetratricopeptide (TPR) repeat protein
MPADEAIRRCDAIREDVRSSPVSAAVIGHPLAALHAMRGDAATAARLLAESHAILAELGRIQSAVSHHEAAVALLGGRPDVAEAHLRKGYEALRAVGERGTLATTSAMLAQAVYDQGRHDEADELCAATAEMAAPDDLVTQVIWRRVRAKVLAGRGRHDEAAALMREALDGLERTDLLSEHGDALLDLAEVERLAGRPAAAEAAARRALERYERKGNLVSAEWARARLGSAGDDRTTEVDGAAALAVRQAGDAPG